MSPSLCQLQLKLVICSRISGMSGNMKMERNFPMHSKSFAAEDSVQTLNEKLEEGIAGKPQIFGGEHFWKKLLTAI